MSLTSQSRNISIIIYSALLVADGGESTQTKTKTIDGQKPEEDIHKLEAIKDAQRAYEQRRRTYGDIFEHTSDSDSDDIKNNEDKQSTKSSTNTDSDAPTSTDSDSPYGSDSESSSSYDEYYAKREIPKKKVHRHHKGPFKSYIEERIGNWPKYRYKKYKRHHMKKQGIKITYGNIHTKEIKHSLKDEKRARKKEENQSTTVLNLMGDVAKQTSFLSLDPEHPLSPLEVEKISLASSKSLENEQTPTKSKSTFGKMKQKIKKSFKRQYKTSAQQLTDEDERMATNSDAASYTSGGGEDVLRINRSFEKL